MAITAQHIYTVQTVVNEEKSHQQRAQSIYHLQIKHTVEKTKHTAALTTATANQSQLTITEEIDFQEGAPHSAPQHIHMNFAYVYVWPP